MRRLPLLVALVAPLAAAQLDPAPSTAEFAPGLTLAVDWGPIAGVEVVDTDGDGRPESVGGCDRWVGEFWPDMDRAGAVDDNAHLVLREAVVTIGGRRTRLDTECVGAYVWSIPSPTAEAFEVVRLFPDVAEVTILLNWDAAGGTALTWTVGPEGSRRSASWRANDRGVGTALRTAFDAEEDARDQVAQALAASVAAERAAEEARAVVERRRSALRRAQAWAREAVATSGPVLDSLGVEVPAPPPLAAIPLALSACAVVPDSTARVEPGASATLSATVATSEAAVAWVDFGDGTTALVPVEDGRLRVSHVYAFPSVFRATVTAIDPTGSEACAVDVVVGDGEEPYCADVTELNPVFFDLRRAEVTADGDARIEENVDLLRRCPSVCVQIDGFGDEYDDLTATEARAEAVRAAYVARGIAPGRLEAIGRGEGTNCVAIEDPGPGDPRCRRAISVPVACATLR